MLVNNNGDDGEGDGNDGNDEWQFMQLSLLAMPSSSYPLPTLPTTV